MDYEVYDRADRATAADLGLSPIHDDLCPLLTPEDYMTVLSCNVAPNHPPRVAQRTAPVVILTAAKRQRWLAMLQSVVDELADKQLQVEQFRQQAITDSRRAEKALAQFESALNVKEGAQDTLRLAERDIDEKNSEIADLRAGMNEVRKTLDSVGVTEGSLVARIRYLAAERNDWKRRAISLCADDSNKDEPEDTVA